MLNRLFLKVSSSYKLWGLLVFLGLIGLFILVRPLLWPTELKIGDDFSLDSFGSAENVSVYIRQFRCTQVEQVKLRSFAVKAGKATPIWDGNYTRTKGVEPPSSSCLFLLLSGAEFKTPAIEFSFAGGSSASGAGKSLSWQQSQNASRLPVRTAPQSVPSSSNDSPPEWIRTSVLQQPPPKTSLQLGKPMLLYLRASGSAIERQKFQLPQFTSIQAVKDFSNQHQTLEFLAVEILWSQ